MEIRKFCVSRVGTRSEVHKLEILCVCVCVCKHLTICTVCVLGEGVEVVVFL